MGDEQDCIRVETRGIEKEWTIKLTLGSSLTQLIAFIDVVIIIVLGGTVVSDLAGGAVFTGGVHINARVSVTARHPISSTVIIRFAVSARTTSSAVNALMGLVTLRTITAGTVQFAIYTVSFCWLGLKEVSNIEVTSLLGHGEFSDAILVSVDAQDGKGSERLGDGSELHDGRF